MLHDIICTNGMLHSFELIHRIDQTFECCLCGTTLYSKEDIKSIKTGESNKSLLNDRLPKGWRAEVFGSGKRKRINVTQRMENHAYYVDFVRAIFPYRGETDIDLVVKLAKEDCPGPYVRCSTKSCRKPVLFEDDMFSDFGKITCAGTCDYPTVSRNVCYRCNGSGNASTGSSGEMGGWTYDNCPACGGSGRPLPEYKKKWGWWY